MGGLAAVVAAGIIAIVFMQAFSTYYTTSSQSSNLFLQSIKEQAQQAENSLREALLLSNLTISNSSSISFLATNTGTISIPATNFGEINVFIQYTNANLTTEYREVNYVPGAVGQNDTWRLTNVTTSSGKPQVLNPIPLPSAASGEWNPSEVLYVAVRLSSSDGVSNSSSMAVVMCMPAGVCSSTSD